MALNLQQGGQMEPVRMVLYGQNGIGKTTFGAGMNQPFILAVEDGIGTMPVWHDKAHAKSYDEIIQTLMDVGGYFQKGEFRSLIVDSMDALQGKIQEKILREHGKKTLNDFSYGKGYELFKQEWESFRNLMERFRVELHANVLLIAQTESKTVADPVNGPHDTYVMRLDKRAVGVLRDWADLVGFAQLKADPVRDRDGNIVRLVTNGTRILCTAPNTAFDAKNRFDLPLELPLAWNSVDKAIQEAYQRPFDPHRFAQASINGFGAPVSPQGVAPLQGVAPGGIASGQGSSGQPTPGFGPAQPRPIRPSPASEFCDSTSASLLTAGRGQAPAAFPASQRPAVVPPRGPSGPGMS